MIYILVHNNQVLNGPRAWNYRSFESTISEDLEMEFKLPMGYTSTDPIIIDGNTRIVSCTMEYAAHNPTIEYLHGPFWNFDNDVAVGTFQVMETPIENVKQYLKQCVTANRWTKEVAGVTVDIQGTTVFVDTSRDGRNIFVQKYILMGDNEVVEWKFPECWLILTKSDLGAVVSAGANHIQTQFTWESTTFTAIDACTTTAELLLIDLGDPPRPTIPNLIGE